MFIIFMWFIVANGGEFQGPLLYGEQNPLYVNLYGTRPDSAQLVSKGQLEWALVSDYSNMYEAYSNQEWLENLDMESFVNDLDFRYGLAQRLEVGVRLTFSTYMDGIFDSIIQDWHRIFGLPNSSRGQTENNIYAFRLSQAEGPINIDLDKRSFSLSGQYLFARFALKTANPLALKLTLKNPSTVEGLKQDSGVFAAEVSHSLSMRHAFLHSHAGYIMLNPNKVLEPLVRQQALFFSETIEYRWRKVNLYTQFSSGTPYFHHTGLSSLDDVPMSFAVGLGQKMRKTQWQVSFVEDISSVGPTVDATLNFSVKRRIR